MMDTPLVWLTVLIPLLLAAGLALEGLRGWICRLTPWASVPALVLALAAPDAYWDAPWLLLGSRWELTGLTRPFLGFTAFVWLCGGMFARGYFMRDSRSWLFDLYWLLSLAGNLWLILARDLAGFYTGFGLMTFAAYGLIVYDRSPEAWRAGRVYLIMAVIGETLLLVGLILASQSLLEPMLAELPAVIAESGRRDLIMALLWIGFGIKAGALLLHLWLPLAHPAAPTPASAVLSGTMIKAGLLGWIQIFPLGQSGFEGWGTVIILLSLAATFGGALVGMAQNHPKVVLAYSSISQMGLIGVLVGAALMVPGQELALISAIALYAVHHGLAKGALFLGVGAAQHLGRRFPGWVGLGLAWPALALAGLPFSSGAVAKQAMKYALEADATLPAWWSWLPFLLSLGAVGTSLLMLRFLWQLKPEFGQKTTSPWLVCGWLLAVVGSLTGLWWLPLMPDAPLSMELSAAKLFDSLWPIGLAVVLALAAARWWRYPVTIPPGDLLVLFTFSGNGLLHRVSDIADALSSLEKRLSHALSRLRELVFRVASQARRLERWWLQEAALVGAALVVVLVVALL